MPSSVKATRNPKRTIVNTREGPSLFLAVRQPEKLICLHIFTEPTLTLFLPPEGFSRRIDVREIPVRKNGIEDRGQIRHRIDNRRAARKVLKFYRAGGLAHSSFFFIF